MTQEVASNVRYGIDINAAEAAYNAKFVGVYDIGNRRGPYLIFYTTNPNRDLGHDNYFALFRKLQIVPGEGELGVEYGDVYITSAKAIRDVVFPAIELEDGSMLVSRWHHDYVTGPRGEMLDDGSSDYYRYSTDFPPTHVMKIEQGEEQFYTNQEWAFELLDAAYGNDDSLSAAMYDVGRFHIYADQPVRYTPQFPSQAEIDFRVALIDEEYNVEFKEACANRDIVAAADALADILYVVIGTAHHFGIQLNKVWEAVQDSNMAKVDWTIGAVAKFPNGKVKKPEGWTPPNVAQVLGIEIPVLSEADNFTVKPLPTSPTHILGVEVREVVRKQDSGDAL